MLRKPLTEIEIENFRTSYCETAYARYQQVDYDAVTMRGIAKSMGCSPMMAFRYFDNKEAVFDTLRATLFHRLADGLEAVPLTLPPLECLTALSIAYAGFALDERHAYRLLYMIHVHQAQDYPETELAQKRTRKILFDATRKATDSDDIEGAPALIAHSIWA
jgi:AcrR family transcriptional regulator